MLEVVIIFLGVLLLLAGLAGCILPVLPGPPLAYLSLLLLQFWAEKPFTTGFLVLVALVVVLITLIDFLIPAIGSKKWGGSRYGMTGALIGVIAGLFFFPPIGFLVFPIVGALLGELLNGRELKIAFKAATGTLAGLFLGSMLKLALTLYIGYCFFTNL